ncbi:MAG: (Fe-S)-binding protein, partial [bacterium]|nr:(Fe-S)-binding protein [bacterium]
MLDLTTLRKETHAALCLACGKCSTMCPLSPSGWFSAARMVAIRDPESEIVRSQGGQAHSLDACLTCGSCEVRCPEGVHFIDFVRGVRGLAASGERRACPHGEMLQSAARVMAGPKPPSRDFAWLEDGLDPDLEIADDGEVALFVGCLPFYDILFERELGLETLEIARSAIRLLNHVGIQPVLLSEERCCGHDLLWNGEREAFEALAGANAEAFEARGVKHIVTTCAECCRTWRMDYPEAAPAYQPRVQHMSEFLAEKIEAGELILNDETTGTLTFQDPCRLGRHLGVIDAPRRVLASIGSNGSQADGNGGENGTSRFVEMDKTGVDAQCCGTSGFIHCDANSKRLQSERLRSAAATGADTLVTACPKCLIHFPCAPSEDRPRKPEAPRTAGQDLTVLAPALLPRAGP